MVPRTTPAPIDPPVAGIQGSAVAGGMADHRHIAVATRTKQGRRISCPETPAPFAISRLEKVAARRLMGNQTVQSKQAGARHFSSRVRELSDSLTLMHDGS
jgi:hypothetical protein